MPRPVTSAAHRSTIRLRAEHLKQPRHRVVRAGRDDGEEVAVDQIAVDDAQRLRGGRSFVKQVGAAIEVAQPIPGRERDNESGADPFEASAAHPGRKGTTIGRIIIRSRNHEYIAFRLACRFGGSPSDPARFLEQLGAVGGSSLVFSAMTSWDLMAGSAGQKPELSGRPAKSKVLVLGGGLSGMVVGYELGKLGYDYQVLEARDRVGGLAVGGASAAPSTPRSAASGRSAPSTKGSTSTSGRGAFRIRTPRC